MPVGLVCIWLPSMVHVQLVQTRSELEADVTTRDKKGESPILNAAENGHIQVVKTLLDLGADFSCADIMGSATRILSASSSPAA